MFSSFSSARYIQYGNGFGEVLRGFLRRVSPVAIKGGESSGGLIQKSQKGQNRGNAAKESILPAAGTVLNEATNSVKQVGRWNRKGNKVSRSAVYKASSRT